MAPSRWSNNEADWQRPSQLTPHSHIAYLPDGPHRTLSTTDAMGHVTHLGGVRPDFSRGSHFPPPPPGIGSRRAQAFQRDAREMNSLRRHPSFNQAQRQQARSHPGELVQQRLRHWLPRQVQQAQLQQGFSHRQHHQGAQRHQPAVQQQMGVQQQMPVQGQLPQKLKFLPGPNQSQAESQRALATQESNLNSDAKPFVGSARPAASASASASAVVPVQGEASGSDISRAGSVHLSDGGSSTAQGNASGGRGLCQTGSQLKASARVYIPQASLTRSSYQKETASQQMSNPDTTTQGMTAAQVAETQAKVDFEQVRKMLFPDPTTAGSIGASEQHLSQQVLKQPVQQSQEQLTDNAASLGGDTVVSGSGSVGTNVLSTSAAEYVPAKKMPKAALVADESSLSVSSLKTETLKGESVSEPKDSFLLSAYRGMDVQPAPRPSSPGSDSSCPQAESAAPCSAVGTTLAPRLTQPPVVLEPAVATAEDAANSMNIATEAASESADSGAVQRSAAKAVAESAPMRSGPSISLPSSSTGQQSLNQQPHQCGNTTAVAESSAESEHPADGSSGGAAPHDRMLDSAVTEDSPSRDAACGQPVLAVAEPAAQPAHSAASTAASASEHHMSMTSVPAGPPSSSNGSRGPLATLDRHPQVAESSLGAPTEGLVSSPLPQEEECSQSRSSILARGTEAHTSDIGHSGPTDGSVLGSSREVDTPAVRHRAAAEQAPAALIHDAQRQRPTQTSSFAQQSAAATAADAEEDPHGSAGSATHEAEVRSGADALQGDRHVAEQQASNPAAFEEPVHSPTTAAGLLHSEQPLPQSGVEDEPQSFVSAQQLGEHHLASSSTASEEQDGSPADAAAPAQPHQSLPQSAVHGEAEPVPDANSQRDEQEAASDQDAVQHASEEEQQQLPSSSTAGDAPDITPDMEEEEEVSTMEEGRRQLEGIVDLISDEEDQQDPTEPDLEEEEEHNSAQSSSQGTEEQLSLHNNIEKEEEQMAQSAAAPLLPDLSASTLQLQTSISSDANPPATDRPQKAVEEVKPKVKPGFLVKALCSIAWPVLLPACFAGGCINLYDACRMTEFLKYTA